MGRVSMDAGASPSADAAGQPAVTGVGPMQPRPPQGALAWGPCVGYPGLISSQESAVMAGTVGREGYRYIPYQFQYSGGVAAAPGYAIERVRFANPVPLSEGFRRIEAFLRDANCPTTA